MAPVVAATNGTISCLCEVEGRKFRFRLQGVAMMQLRFKIIVHCTMLYTSMQIRVQSVCAGRMEGSLVRDDLVAAAVGVVDGGIEPLVAQLPEHHCSWVPETTGSKSHN